MSLGNLLILSPFFSAFHEYGPKVIHWPTKKSIIGFFLYSQWCRVTDSHQSGLDRFQEMVFGQNPHRASLNESFKSCNLSAYNITF